MRVEPLMLRALLDQQESEVVGRTIVVTLPLLEERFVPWEVSGLQLSVEATKESAVM